MWKKKRYLQICHACTVTNVYEVQQSVNDLSKKTSIRQFFCTTDYCQLLPTIVVFHCFLSDACTTLLFVVMCVKSLVATHI